jgi:excisionase family DNA binding protein
MNQLLTVAQVAELLAVSESLIYRLASDGEIPCYRIGKGALRFREEDIESYLASRIHGKSRARRPRTASGPVFKHLNASRLAAAWREQDVS